MPLFISREERIRHLGFDDRWAMILGIPILAGIAFLLFTGMREEVTPFELSLCYFLAIAHVVAYWVSLRYVMIVLRRRFPGEAETKKRILYYLPLAALIVLLIGRLSFYLVPAVFPFMLEVGWQNVSLIFDFVVSFTLAAMTIAIYESVYFFVKYRKSAAERERLARENMQSQLAVLKQQVNPHFLFNSLNTLVNVIPEDTDKAVLFTQRLAAVYRRVLEYRHRELITLEEELTALQDYVFLMRTRFEDKLEVRIDTAGARVRANHKVVPLTLQLLAENAIKHNVISQELPLTIDISVGEDRVTVTNTLRLRNRHLHSTGWGHQNIRQRYRAVTDAAVLIDSTDTKYSVSVPLLAPEKTIASVAV